VNARREGSRRGREKKQKQEKTKLRADMRESILSKDKEMGKLQEQTHLTITQRTVPSGQKLTNGCLCLEYPLKMALLRRERSAKLQPRLRTGREERFVLGKTKRRGLQNSGALLNETLKKMILGQSSLPCYARVKAKGRG